MTTLLRALGKLPPMEGLTVYRGTRLKLAQLAPLYYEGRKVVWSGFASTSKTPHVAADLAGPGGVILKIKIFTGRDISLFSIFGLKEAEVLLAPSTAYLVNAQPYERAFVLNDGTSRTHHLIDFVEIRGDELVT